MTDASILSIGDVKIGEGHPTFFIAEISANHDQDLKKAKALVHAAADAGCDAIKLQTYTPDTITIDSRNPEFMVNGTIWEGQSLYELYQKAYTPWEWHEELFDLAKSLGMIAFSSPFDFTAVDFLQNLDVPMWKIASSELVDIPLLAMVAKTGKPVILSTGMATLDEIEEAVETLRANGCKQLALLKCTAAYPAKAEDANLKTIPDMRSRFNCPVGLSDHTLDLAVPLVAIGLGACIVEKHITLDRREKGIDAAFSLEPAELKQLIAQIRIADTARGKVNYEPSEGELISRKFRRSLYAVKDIQKGEKFTPENVRSIRPANGLHPRKYPDILEKKSTGKIIAGTPISGVHYRENEG